MAKYFIISAGLRGCYMPDSSFVIKADSRRDLKATLEQEAYYIRDAEFVGLSKRAIASLAASAWRAAHCRFSPHDYVAPYGRKDDASNKPYGLFVTVASRADYLEYLKENE